MTVEVLKVINNLTALSFSIIFLYFLLLQSKIFLYLFWNQNQWGFKKKKCRNQMFSWTYQGWIQRSLVHRKTKSFSWRKLILFIKYKIWKNLAMVFAKKIQISVKIGFPYDHLEVTRISSNLRRVYFFKKKFKLKHVESENETSIPKEMNLTDVINRCFYVILFFVLFQFLFYGQP